MVKGVSRRVVVVRPKNGATFEQAIFIVRDDRRGSQDILREACSVAESYIERTLHRLPQKRYTRIHLFGAGICGALLTSLLWLTTLLFL